MSPYPICFEPRPKTALTRPALQPIAGVGQAPPCGGLGQKAFGSADCRQRRSRYPSLLVATPVHILPPEYGGLEAGQRRAAPTHRPGSARNAPPVPPVIAPVVRSLYTGAPRARLERGSVDDNFSGFKLIPFSGDSGATSLTRLFDPSRAQHRAWTCSRVARMVGARPEPCGDSRDGPCGLPQRRSGPALLVPPAQTLLRLSSPGESAGSAEHAPTPHPDPSFKLPLKNSGKVIPGIHPRCSPTLPPPPLHGSVADNIRIHSFCCRSHGADGEVASSS